jgi:hypothetical protein
MPLPPFDESTGYLPPGDHEMTVNDFMDTLGGRGFSYTRYKLLEGFRFIVRELEALGVERIWIGGSFSTAKPSPSDIDLAYLPTFNFDDPGHGLLYFGNRGKLKAKFRIDLWPESVRIRQPQGGNGWGRMQTIKEFWESDSDGTPRGLVTMSIKERGA